MSLSLRAERRLFCAVNEDIEIMKCKKCNSEMKIVEVEVKGTSSKSMSYQCPNCDYYEFEPNSSENVLKGLRRK